MNQGRGLPLVGRGRECDALDSLLGAVRSGHGRALVLRGEAGAGKSALLEYLAGRAVDCRVVRAVGVESEAELPFAGLHQLCSPLLGGLARLADPQRLALQIAFGMGESGAPDPFSTGLAVLGLLSDAASDRPLLCLVDDAQWMDRESARVLGFVARRLLAEAAALVFVLRVPCEDEDFRGLTVLPVGGVDDEAAHALLDIAIPGLIDTQVRRRILAECRGNPLALLELPKSLTAAELGGGFRVPSSAALTGRIEQSFLQRVRALPSSTQTLLLLAAAEPTGDVTLLTRAAERLGIALDAALPAVAADFVELGPQVRFKHPLVRSAIYRAAELQDRLAVHRVLWEVTDPDGDPDRRAWHRAQAVVAPDEDVADELERSAGRAQRRGGATAAATFLRKATFLSPEATRRGMRAVAAAWASFEAGAPEATREVMAAAELCPLTPLQRAQLVRLRAKIAFAERRGRDAPPLLVDAAVRFAAVDAGVARETYMEALEAAIIVGRLGDEVGMRAVADAARSAPPPSRPPRPVDLLLDAMIELLTSGYEEGLPALREALVRLTGQRTEGKADAMRWLSLAPVAQEAAVHELWDYDAWEAIATRSVSLSREFGALGTLPAALVYLAGVRLHAGDFASAGSMIDEADSITATTRFAPVSYASLVLAAWRGDLATATEMVGTTVEDATSRGEGTVLSVAGYALAVLNNGLSRYQAAFDAARDGATTEDFSFAGWTLVEMVEAASRLGDREAAAAALERLAERVRYVDSAWGLGLFARSRALLEEGDEADAFYREAIERLSGSRMACHLARAHLVYGEWLRREGRRNEGAEQLQIAHGMFERFGAAAFAERARRELEAAGMRASRRSPAPHDALTAQEARVAALAADGYTNAEIGSQLFISARTAEYHLRKVFGKLGISSRRSLRKALGS